MRQYIQLLCLISVCKLSIGCGAPKQDAPSIEDQEHRPEFTLVAPAGYYFKEDLSCLPRGSKTAKIIQATVYTANLAKITQATRSLAGASSGWSFRTPAVKETFYGGVYEANCEEANLDLCAGKYLNVREWQIVEKRKPLSICRTNGNYRLFSYEAIALSMAYAIENASTLASQNIPNLTLSPVTLEIMPRFRLRRPPLAAQEKQADALIYATRQMSYAVNEKSIVVYPERANQPRSRPQFWQSSFVISHEYGHHVEWELKRQLANQASPHAYEAFTTKLTSHERKADKALSEAFADLLAFYTLKESPRALAEFPREHHDRNPKNTIFSDGQTTKVLNENALEALKAQGDLASEAGLIDLSRVHILGAIFAHGLDRIFAVTAANASGRSDENAKTRDKYRHAVRWYTDYLQLKSEALAAQSWHEIDIMKIFQASLKRIITRDQQLTLAVCSTYKKQFPALPHLCHN